MVTTPTAPPKRRRSAALVLALAAALLLPAPGFGQAAEAEPEPEPETIDRYGDLVSIFGGRIHVPANVNQRGTVFSLGGDVSIEGSVREAVVIFGRLEVTGEVRQQVVGIMSRVTLDGAEVGDQVVNILGSYDSRDTKVDGQVVNVSFGGWFPGLGWIIFWIRMVSLVAAFVVLLLLAALVPERIAVVAEVAPRRYLTAFLVGILGYLGMLVVVGLLAATLIGIPLALFVFYVLRWIGIAGIFYAVGRRIGRAAGAELSLLGAVLICFAPYAALKLATAFLGLWGLLLASFVGLLFFLLIDVPGIGLLILTRLGTRPDAPWPLPAPPPPAPAPPAPFEPSMVGPAGPPPV